MGGRPALSPGAMCLGLDGGVEKGMQKNRIFNCFNRS